MKQKYILLPESDWNKIITLLESEERIASLSRRENPFKADMSKILSSIQEQLSGTSESKKKVARIPSFPAYAQYQQAPYELRTITETSSGSTYAKYVNAEDREIEAEYRGRGLLYVRWSEQRLHRSTAAAFRRVLTAIQAERQKEHMRRYSKYSRP